MPKILAVDDSATMRQVIDLTFRGLEGFEVKTFDSADQAIQHAESSGADLILADASMNPDGYELCRRVKANGATAAIPVIILASQQTPFDADKARAAGADDHALKPYDTNTFIDKVRAVIATAKKQPVPAAMGATYRQAPVTLGGAAFGPSAPATAAPAAPAGSPIAAKSAVPAAIPGVLGVAAPKPPQRMTATFGAPLPTPLPNQAKRPVLELSDDDDTMTPAPLAPRARVVTPGAMPAAAAALAPIAPPAPEPPAPLAAMPVAAVAAPIAAAAKAAAPQIAAKLEGMGLSADQIQGVLNLTRDVIERVVWEVVPDLAETIIREEIKRLTK